MTGTVRRAVRISLTLFIIGSVLAPQTSFAAKRTYKPPFLFQNAQQFCESRSAYGTSVCSGMTNAVARTGSMSVEARITSPNAGMGPGRGNAFSIGLIGGVASTDSARSIPITVTIFVRSAIASTPMPHSVVATGSSALAGLQMYFVHTFCYRECTAIKDVSVVTAGTLDSVSSVKGKTYTVNLTLRHRNARRLPAGTVAFGIAGYSFASVGRSTRKPIPVEEFPLPDVGSSRAKLDVLIKSISVG
ncbi:MAG TPA: hypothetical protein VM600_09505 [Actinomycetota bacterium]|nr:hypothetical protein [Actinomycetota bacterium]